MNRKKEPKELIEVLLREQRKRSPAGEDPLEGIEWEGLPDGLRDKVYHPPEQKEPLVDLLLSVEREKRRARAHGERAAADGGDAAAPERPGFRERWGTWLGHTFGFLGKTCEVRVATVIAFAGSSLFLTFVAYLFGFERGRAEDAPFSYKSYHGAPNELGIEAPVGTSPPEAVAPAKPVQADGGASFDARKGPVAPAAGAAKTTAPRLPWVIRIATVPSTPKNRESADTLCTRLRQSGIPDPAVVMIDSDGRKQIVVIAGGWPDKSKAEEAFVSLRPKIESVKGVEDFGPLMPSGAWRP